jgi:hypothetical protein
MVNVSELAAEPVPAPTAAPAAQPAVPSQPTPQAEDQPATEAAAPEKEETWVQLISAGNEKEIKERLAKESNEILATLIALGADEIHMSQLGQLGPIDPQLGGLPALGVAQALERIATLSQKFPGSAEMFAKYLQLALTVEQIGYCERIAQSAQQYAQRLLAAKNRSVTERPTSPESLSTTTSITGSSLTLPKRVSISALNGLRIQRPRLPRRRHCTPYSRS